MKNVSTENIRNLCLVGKAGSGKTSLVEAILFTAGVTNRLGKIEEGNTVCDYQDDEKERRMSINMKLASFEHAGKKFNLMDTPGCADLCGEAVSALTVSDAVVFVLGVDTPIDVSTEEALEPVAWSKKPVLIFINKTDKPDINLDEFLKTVDAKLELKTCTLVVPGADAGTSVNLLTLKKADASGREADLGETDGRIESLRERLIDAVAAHDDKLIEKYLGGEKLSAEEMTGAFRKGFKEGKIVPVVCGSAAACAGIRSFLNVVAEFFPAPDISRGQNKGLFSGIIFKTMSEPGMGQMNFVRACSGKLSTGLDVYNVTRQKRERIGPVCFMQGRTRVDAGSLDAGDIGVLVKLKETRTGDSLVDDKIGKDKPEGIPTIDFPPTLMDMAVYTKSKGEEEKVGNALSTMTIEDPTLKFQYNGETREMILSGVGNLQLEIARSRIKARYGIDVELRSPRVPYKETVRGRAEGQGKHKKQTGGRGQYGDCWIRIEPLERGKGFEFVDDIFGGAIPKNFIPSIEKGVKESMERGIISGHPVVDVKITVYDGSYHEVDSSDQAFKIAGSLALKKVFPEARPCLIEPIMNLEVIIPEEYVGAVMGDLNARRGRIMGIDRFKKRQVVKAQVPLGEMTTYAPDLRSMAKGSGKFKLQFSHYEELPAHIAKNLIEAHQKTRAPEE